MSQRVKILAGEHSGKLATVLAATAPENRNRVVVFIDGYLYSTGVRGYLPEQLQAVVAPVPPAPVPPAPTAELPDAPSGWRRIFYDDFSSGALDPAKWSAYPSGWRDTSKHGIYDPSIISVRDGRLDMHVHTRDGIPRVAAPYPLLPAPAVRYERFGRVFTALPAMRVTVRMRSDRLPGYKVAWLTWPKSDDDALAANQPSTWPRDGENDYPEGDLDGVHTAKMFMHRQGATVSNDQDYWDSGAVLADGQWHTFTSEWIAGKSYRCFADGRASQIVTSRVPNTPMRYVLQTETELLPSPIPDPSVSGHVQVEAIAVDVPA